MKRAISFILTLCVLISCIITADVFPMKTNAAQVDGAAVGAGTGPQSSVQGGAILHCFNWSYNNIKSNLKAIRDAGYTAVQTSPVQSPKDYNWNWRDQSNQWWKLYQPLNFDISNNTWLGSKQDLKSLCDEADKYGIKVIVDIVANHLSGNQAGYNNLDGNVDSSLKRWEYFHDNYNGANDNSRYEMTTGHIGMPDLNTSHPDIQNRVKNLLIECIGIGVDGFRFDAAKHIELPNDQGNSSQFWPTVINGSRASTSNEIFYYGEILNGCATDIGNYTQYMSITDNYTSDKVLVAANNSNAQGLADSNYYKGAAADKNVLWAESHDTYMGESGSAGMGCTKYVSDHNIVKAWAMVASREGATALFFARPANDMGNASTNTTWKSKAVTEINQFKNYFEGQSEYLSNDGSFAYNERGTSGVIIVNANGSSASVNVPAKKMAQGTYKDQITGNSFTVSNGRITGNIGDTGVAVVYNESAVTPTVPPTQAPTTPPTQNTATFMYGDADESLSINIIDVTCVQRHAAQIRTLTGTAFSAADVNEDGNVNIMDATVIQRHIAGIKSSTKCGQYSNGTAVTPTQPPTIAPTTAPTSTPVVLGNYVYFRKPSDWGEVKVYYWNDNDTNMIQWPGLHMEHIGNEVFKAEVPSNITMVIFNNNNQGEQTEDIRFDGMNKIYENGSWSNYTG